MKAAAEGSQAFLCRPDKKESQMGEQTNQVQLKNFNRRTVLNYIRKNKTATKAGLATATGLTFMAIKKILEELEGLHLIR